MRDPMAKFREIVRRKRLFGYYEKLSPYGKYKTEEERKEAIRIQKRDFNRRKRHSLSLEIQMMAAEGRSTLQLV